ncbi:PREDICTED: uncharacterized protein LOC105361903 [Ceratosolen solmsi marchali]|uniref:Uncharacterized protein LOC105361903 n=1 Tax=Ceratosolen solmsi marchali TaxID=326594 RepID=A0AAJ6YG92_9HYME|nr:PREDICTED: uncharacterized protein LOC105361903 [Ceratosolen solmsi marchali]
MSEEVTWSTTEMTLTPEEEDTIVTLVVVVIGILAAIIFLFSMGLFIDCRTQKKVGATSKRKRLRLKMPPLGRAQRQQRTGTRREDSKCLAADMCPNGASEYASTCCVDVIV